MKKVFLLIAVFAFVTVVNAQDPTTQELKNAATKTITKDPNDTLSKVWKVGGIFNFTFGQTSLSNWAAGGDDLQLNINSVLNLHAFYAKGRSAWDNTLDLGL